MLYLQYMFLYPRVSNRYVHKWQRREEKKKAHNREESRSARYVWLPILQRLKKCHYINLNPTVN